MGMLTTTELTVKNKTDLEVYIEFVPEDATKQSYSSVISPETNVTLAIPTGKYWVFASSREVEWSDAGTRVNSQFTPCFGYGDEGLWDENQAKRLYEFSPGKRNFPIPKARCRSLEDSVYFEWRGLEFKTLKFTKNVFQYIY